MANTLTDLIPTIYEAADMVAREQVGFLPAVYKNSEVEEVALNQTIRYPIVAAQTAGDVTPAMTLPNPSGQTVGNGTMAITKERNVLFPWNGNEQKGLGKSYDTVLRDQFAQSFRTLVNEIETDLFLAAKNGASRAYGTAGTTPFPTAADFSDFAQILKILKDNGAPTTDLHLVLNTTAAANIRGKQSGLFKANEAGDVALLRDAKLGRIEGMDVHESGQIVTHTKGTGTGYVFNGSHAVGATTIAADTGSNTLVAGDVLAFEDDTRKYVANTALSGGSFTIGGPGLRQAQVDAKTITIGNNYLGNWAFERNAIHLLTRLPMTTREKDAAADRIVFVDPFSGIAFEVTLWAGNRMIVYEVAVAWGVKAVKSDFIATLLG